MLESREFLVLTLLLAVLVASGCRTYGGRGVQEKTYEVMQTTVQSMEGELERAKADGRRLKEAAAENDELTSILHRYEKLVHEHESLLADQRKRVEHLSSESDPRSLRRAYGAMVTERRMLKRKYQHLIENVRTAVQGATDTSGGESMSSRQYTTTPVGFPDGEEAGALSMQQALRGR